MTRDFRFRLLLVGFLLACVTVAPAGYGAHRGTGVRPVFADDAAQDDLDDLEEAEAAEEKPIEPGPPALTEREEILGERLAMVSDVTSLFVDNDALQARLQHLCERIAPTTPRHAVPYHVTVVKAPDFNAWVVADGRVYVTDTLVELLRTDDAIGAVLAHEMGHVIAEHPTEMYNRTLVMGAIATALKVASATGVTAVPIGGVDRVVLDMAGVAQNMMVLMGLKYSRGEEAEADRLAFNHVQQAGLDPSGVPQAFQTMLEMTLKRPAAGLIIYSTHPHPEWRLERGLERLGRTPGGTEYLEGLTEEPANTDLAPQWLRPALWFDPDVFPVLLYQHDKRRRPRIGVVDIGRMLRSERFVERFARRSKKLSQKLGKTLQRSEESLKKVWDKPDTDKALVRAKWLFEVRRANARLAGERQDFNEEVLRALTKNLRALAEKKKLSAVYRLDHLPAEYTDTVNLTDRLLVEMDL